MDIPHPVVNTSDGLILAANAPTDEAHAATLGALVALAETGLLQQCKVFISLRHANMLVYQLNQLAGHAHHSREPFQLVSDDELDDASTADDSDEHKASEDMSLPTLERAGVLAAGGLSFFPSHSVSFADPVTPLGQAIARHLVPAALSFITENHELSAMRLYASALRRNLGLRLRFCCSDKTTISAAYYSLAVEWSKRIGFLSTWNEVYTYAKGRSTLCLPTLAPEADVRLYDHAVTQSYSVFPAYNTTTRKSVLFHNRQATGEWISEEQQQSLAYYTQGIAESANTAEDTAENIISSLVVDPGTWGQLTLPNCSFESNLQLDPTLRHAADLYFQFTRMPKIGSLLDVDDVPDDDWLRRQILGAPSRRVILLDGICDNLFFQEHHPHTYTRAVISTGEYNASNSGESVQFFNSSHGSFCSESFLTDHHRHAHSLCVNANPALTTNLSSIDFYNLIDWGYHVASQAFVPTRFQA